MVQFAWLEPKKIQRGGIMQQSSFPIGAWVYRDLNQVTKETIDEWRECGLTLTFSPDFRPSRNHDKKKMLEIMDYCYECGIKLIICDDRSHWRGAAKDPEGYRKAFQEAYNDFGKHKATWGFHVGDEPFMQHVDDVVMAYKIQLEVAPELVPFVNYLPLWEPSIDEIADAIFPNIEMKNMCYDYYAQMVKDTKPDGYFTQLRRFKEHADKGGAPLWTTLLSMGHWAYREPTKDDFVWQLNTAVASGCEGILWFHFYTNPEHCSYRNGPINKFGERTRTYTDLSEANREFHHYFGEAFTHLKLVKSYHVGEAFGGFPLFKEGDSDVILKIEDPRDHHPAILSFFKDENGDDYFAIVNNTRFDPSRIHMTISSKAGKIIDVANDMPITPTKITQALAVGGVTATKEEDKIPDSYEHMNWYAPGMMKLYKIEK